MTTSMKKNITESRMIELIQEEFESIKKQLTEAQINALYGPSEIVKVSLSEIGAGRDVSFTKSLDMAARRQRANKEQAGRITDISQEKAEEHVRKAFKKFKDINDPKDWEVQNALTSIIINLWVDTDFNNSNWDDLKHSRQAIVEQILRSIDIDQRTAWEIVDPHLNSAASTAMDNVLNTMEKEIDDVVDLFNAGHLAKQHEFWTSGKSAKELRDAVKYWKDNKNSIGLLAQTLVLILGSTLAVKGATMGGLFVGLSSLGLMTLSDFDEIYDAVDKKKWGAAAVIVIQIFIGKILKSLRKLVSGFSSYRPFMKYFVDTWKLISEEWGRNLDHVFNFIIVVLTIEGGKRAWVNAYDAGSKEYAKTIPALETGTFGVVDGKYLTPEERKSSMSALHDLDSPTKEPTEPTAKEVIDSLTPEDKAVIKAKMDELKRGTDKLFADYYRTVAPAGEVNPTNESLFSELRFSKLAGITS